MSTLSFQTPTQSQLPNTESSSARGLLKRVLLLFSSLSKNFHHSQSMGCDSNNSSNSDRSWTFSNFLVLRCHVYMYELEILCTNLVAVDEGRVLLPHHTSSIIKEWMNVEPIRQSTVYCCHVLFSFDWLKQYLRLHVINSRWYHDFYVFLCIITSLTTRHVFIIRLISFIFLYIKCFCFLGGFLGFLVW